MSFVYSHPFTGLANGLNTMQGGGGIGGWVELGRTTLGSAGDTIDVTGLSDKRYLMVLSDATFRTGDITCDYRINGDSGSNYAFRGVADGASDFTQTSRTYAYNTNALSNCGKFAVAYIANYSSKEKLMINHYVEQNTAGAGNAPSRSENVNKWTNTSNAISQITNHNRSTGDFTSGAEMVVLGWDPADTHTNNFWSELASVDNAGVTDNLSSGTFTAKKYLWVQFYLKPSGNNTQRHLTFNNDTGSNYARRISGNGGADSTSTSQAYINLADSSGAEYDFHNMFIINNSSNEKLGILHSVIATATGAATAPLRREMVFKWDNTASQITEIDLTNTTGAVDYTISGIRVWGAD